jgi:hypothetical protein
VGPASASAMSRVAADVVRRGTMAFPDVVMFD